MYPILILFIGTIAVKATPSKDANCRISIGNSRGDLSEPQPLILTDTTTPNFVLPNEKKNLIIPSNTSILLACPGKHNSLQNFKSKQVVKAKCLTGKQFLVGSTTHSFKTFKCKRLPEESVKKVDFPCLSVHQKYEIGFDINNHFLILFEICRDEVSYRTYYTKHTLVKEIKSLQYGHPRPDNWKSGTFYPDFDVDKLYTFAFQRKNLATLLGSRELAEKFVTVIHSETIKKQDLWQMCVRGHLTPKADFVYSAQQLTTFWFLNANPQWGSFNAGNWMRLENAVRRLAASRQMDLIVYTGVHGITTLKDINGDDKFLYLFSNNTEKLMSAPRFYWKIIHDPISNRATAFVGLNEPYADEITDDMYLCSDISHDYDFSWLNWQPNDIKLGVSYICTVDSLREAVTTIPEIGETDLLV